LPKIGEGLGEWSEAPSYEEGVGVDGRLQGIALLRLQISACKKPAFSIKMIRKCLDFYQKASHNWIFYEYFAKKSCKLTYKFVPLHPKKR